MANKTCCDGTGWTGDPRVICTDHYEPCDDYFQFDYESETY